MRDHESLLLLRGLAFPSAPTVRASRLRGQGQLGGPHLPRRSYTPRHARLDPRARHRDPDRWLNTEARWRARWSAGGKALARTRRTRDWRHPRRSPCTPRAPRGVGTCLCRVSRHTGPPLGPLPAPRELQGPLAETAPRARPSLARPPVQGSARPLHAARL